jgi:hypothetical protein
MGDRLADRLDYLNPAERVGVVAARCGFLRPSEAPRHRSQMPVAVAIERCSRVHAHSADHQRRARKGWCARAAWCAPFRSLIKQQPLVAGRAWPLAAVPASAASTAVPAAGSGASVKGRIGSAPDACVAAPTLTVNTIHTGRELEPGTPMPTGLLTRADSHPTPRHNRLSNRCVLAAMI